MDIPTHLPWTGPAWWKMSWRNRMGRDGSLLSPYLHQCIQLLGASWEWELGRTPTQVITWEGMWWRSGGNFSQSEESTHAAFFLTSPSPKWSLQRPGSRPQQQEGRQQPHPCMPLNLPARPPSWRHTHKSPGLEIMMSNLKSLTGLIRTFTSVYFLDWSGLEGPFIILGCSFACARRQKMLCVSSVLRSRLRDYLGLVTRHHTTHPLTGSRQGNGSASGVLMM